MRLALILTLLVLGFVLLCKGLVDCWGRWRRFADTSTVSRSSVAFVVGRIDSASRGVPL